MKNKLLKKAPFLWLILIIIGLMLYLWFYFMNTCNDDTSAEMILSFILSKEGGICTKDWIYSTEIRVFNTQLVYSFLFRFVTSWKLVRVLGNGILYIALLASTYYLCTQLKIKKYFPIVGALMILPLSREYFEFTVHGAYLIPHFIVSLLTIAMYIDFKSFHGRRNRILFCLINLLALIAGLGGMRHILICYIPLALLSVIQLISSEVKKEKTTHIILAFITLISSFVGYIINCLFLQKLINSDIDFSTSMYGKPILYGEIHFSRIEEIINGWLKCYSWNYGKNIFSVGTICNITALIFIFMSAVIIKRYKIISEESKVIVIFWFFSSILITALFVFTDMVFYPRYLFQAHIFLFPSIACVYNEISFEQIIKKIIVVFFIIQISLVSAYNLYEYIGENYTQDMRKAVDKLVEKGYTYGYSDSYWYWGNGITEYSNGKVINYRIGTKDGYNYYVMRWLMPKSWLKDIPNDKVYIIVSNDVEANSYDELIYKSDEESVYGYMSYEKLKKDFNIEY